MSKRYGLKKDMPTKTAIQNCNFTANVTIKTMPAIEAAIHGYRDAIQGLNKALELLQKAEDAQITLLEVDTDISKVNGGEFKGSPNAKVTCFKSNSLNSKRD